MNGPQGNWIVKFEKLHPRFNTREGRCCHALNGMVWIKCCLKRALFDAKCCIDMGLQITTPLPKRLQSIASKHES